MGLLVWSGGRRKEDEDWQRTVGCLRSWEAECDEEWWELAKPSRHQAGVPSVTSAAAGNVSNPSTRTNNTNTRDMTGSFPVDH